MASYFQTIFLHEKSRILQIVRESKQKHSQHALIMTIVCANAKANAYGIE